MRGLRINPEWRVRYLGQGWDLARVRGTRHNTGDGIRMALEIGAVPFGNWSGCHSVAWDISAPPFGDRWVLDNFQNTPTRWASWSTSMASASSTRASTTAT